MTDRACPTCGANLTGKICQYCGRLLDVITTTDHEKQALEEFHRHLGNAEKTVKIRLLRTGFLPDKTEVLIEAGMRCIPMINKEELSEEPRNSIIQRLQAITVKLRIKAKKNSELKALAEFEKALAQHKSSERLYLFIGLIFFAIVFWFLYKLFN